MSEKLNPLPCPNPNCGSTKLNIYTEAFINIVFVFVVCLDCNMCGPTGETKEASVVAWNALARGIVWTTDPPNVEGKYFHDFEGVVTIRPVQSSDIATMRPCKPGERWAGPIRMPLEAKHVHQ